VAQRIHAIVSGRVQGVGFREYVYQEAVALGLSGWVGNRPDGTVEVVAEGPEESTQRLARRLKEGPRLARVQTVVVDTQPATGEFTRFSVAHLV
jgi:acylphosphatase